MYKLCSEMQGGSVSGFYLVSSLSEIWVKIQPGLWLAVEKVWVPQLVLCTEPPSWLGSVGLRHGMLQAWEKVFPHTPTSPRFRQGWLCLSPSWGQISLLHNLIQCSARDTLAWVPAGRSVGQWDKPMNAHHLSHS